ncbi:CYtochrome P450 family [Caenorhabditis elegans]|uniref:CYtochrome P450 family n=1 Tax=Caenorhabditis elegans TaxID=6239 RepID=Q20315_CAEEL|nr:CYtochrome P450 family [Caenorhabditis elegans]CCD67658.1 CYtochrome P450 family [Caenorhabditis elegans]|eukprot:NP_501471.1 CYtochrome P450 family [Caenorhabditis elegans]
MILALSLALLFLYLFHFIYWKRRNLPPGPAPLPFVGNLLMLTEKVKPGYKLWDSLTQQYGSVFTFWMAGLPMVFVTDWKLIKQYFIKDGGSYVGRPEFPLNTEVKKGPYGIIDAHGNRWIQQRRFALHVLRDFGLGKNIMEEKILTEVTVMIERLRKTIACVDMQNVFDTSIGSIINSLIFGYRFDESEFGWKFEKSRRACSIFNWKTTVSRRRTCQNGIISVFCKLVQYIRYSTS